MLDLRSCSSCSSRSTALLLREVRWEGPRPGEALHATPRFRAIGAITGILPGVAVPVWTGEHRYRGEAQCVGTISGGSEALRHCCTVASMVISDGRS